MRLAIPSLRLRLVLVMGLAYVVVAATTLFTGYTVQQQSLHGQLVARAKSDAAILAAGAVGFGTGLSLGPLRTFLSSLEHRTQGVSYAAVTDSSGKVIASTNPHSRHRRLAVSLPRRPTSIVLKGGGVEGIAPIVQPGGTALGLAVVRLGGQSIASDLRNSLLLEAATQLLGLAIFLVLSLIISQYILGPLLALSRAASSLRRGDLGARVRQRGGTELTAVAEAFNDMASALEQRIKHLSFLAQTGSALPNALRYRGDIHPILQDFCRQIPARVAGLMFTDEDRAIWHAASPNPHYQEVAGAVAAQAKDATALVQDEVSVMVVPVMGGAVFAVAREAEAPFTGEEQQVVTNFANQIGIAADNARLFESQQEALRVKDQFLSIVSHELRTPLTTIKGYAQMLRHGQVQEIEAARFAETIDAQASRLGRLVDDLLDVTRFTRGQFELERQPGDIRPVVEDVVGRFRIVSPGHQIRLVWDGDRFSGSWDLDRLEQVLNNLLSNAIKYSPEGREVTVVVARQEESVRISVRDEGVGISAEDQEKLFQRFYRAGGEGHQVKGLGLGLYVTRRIIEAHGGTIAVHSETGRGSEFVITLPVEAIAEPSRA